MIRTIYAILLLVAFLKLLSHEMIPHHHHDKVVGDFTVEYKQVASHAHCHGDGHFHYHGQPVEAKANETHSHDANNNLPPHSHITVTNYFVCKRVIVIESFEQVQSFTLYSCIQGYSDGFYKPPEITISRYNNKPDLINHLFEPGANALRAPPSIA